MWPLRLRRGGSDGGGDDHDENGGSARAAAAAAAAARSAVRCPPNPAGGKSGAALRDNNCATQPTSADSAPAATSAVADTTAGARALDPAPAAFELDARELKCSERIGAGTFGEVYRARWRGTDVAVKRLFVRRGREQRVCDGYEENECRNAPTQQRRRQRQRAKNDSGQHFLRELSLLSSLRHPNVVLLLGGSTAPSQPIIVCEYMPRGSLHAVLRSTPSDVALDMRMARDAARALAYLHSLTPPIVHRDVKSHNYLVDEACTVKLSDFGLGRMLALLGERMTPCGSVCYSAPEVIRCEAYSERADVYSYGVVLWEILTRLPDPYPEWSALEVQMRVAHHGARPQLGDGSGARCDARLARIMRACWREDPARRPKMTHVASLLSDLVEEAMPAASSRALVPPQLQPPPPPPHSSLPQRQRRSGAGVRSIGVQTCGADAPVR